MNMVRQEQCKAWHIPLTCMLFVGATATILDVRQLLSSKGTFLSQRATIEKNSGQMPERFSSYMTETKFKMAVTATILDMRWQPSSKGTFLSQSNHEKNSGKLPARFSSYLMETKFNMAATATILDTWQRPLSKGTFLLQRATTKKNFRSKLFGGNQNVNGHRRKDVDIMPQEP